MEKINLAIIIGGLTMSIISSIDLYNRKDKSKNICLIALGVALIILSIFKWCDDNKKDKKLEKSYIQITSLDSNVSHLVKNRTIDSLSNSAFQKNLLEKFNIIRDSQTNEPKMAVYNTNINKAETVNIGGH